MFIPSPIYVQIAQIVFFFGMFLVFYTYIGYPLLMLILSKLFHQPIRRAAIMPNVTMIIAARNEEVSIGEKLENALSLEYPAEKFEIIVASDASSDATDEIVRSFSNRGVILHRQEVRQGKTRAQHRAVSVSSGDILVFSDATTMYEPDALHKIVRNFADPNVGCVGGQLVYVDDKSTSVGQGCRSYWSYEKSLKGWESSFGTLIGVSGCLYAVRRSCHAKLASDMIDDLVIATEIHLQGLRTVYEPEAISKEETNHQTKDEMRMRVRVIEQTISALHRYNAVLNPFKHGQFAFQMICHKIFRYAVPLFLLIAFIANCVALGGGNFFIITFCLQLAIYFTALLGWFAEKSGFKIGGLVSIPYYFMLVNVATVLAFIKFLRGDAHVTWEPVREARPTSVNSQNKSLSEVSM